MSPALPAPIGVFDSGLGGLSVLAELVRVMPGRRWVYVADSAHAPYGERSDHYVQQRSECIAELLLQLHGCAGLVVACNTATAAAAPRLRQLWPQHPIVGVEPGVKPAAQASASGRLGVMATAATLASERFEGLVQAHASGLYVHRQACTGLAGAIESGRLDSAHIKELLDAHCAPLREAGVDTVVLGCTHYRFVLEQIAQRLPGVRLVDTAPAVAMQAARVMPAPPEPQTQSPVRSEIDLISTGNPQALLRFAQNWLGEVGKLRIRSLQDAS
jgi:glutamate racemase